MASSRSRIRRSHSWDSSSTRNRLTPMDASSSAKASSALTAFSRTSLGSAFWPIAAARPSLADAAIIPEPFEGLMSAQMGVMWMTIDVYGLPVHAAYAHTGIAAIDFGHYLVGELRKLESQWNRPECRHPMY